MRRKALLVIVAIFAVGMLSHRSWPSAPRHWFHHGANYMFRDVTVGPGEVVYGNLNVLFGNATIDGRVDGDLNVFGGSCDTTNGTVEGELNCVQTASVGAIAPWIGSAFEDIPFAGESKHLSMTLAWNFIIFLMFLLFPMRARLALARAETQPGLAAMVGLLAFVAVVPLGILLALSIIGIPLIVIELAAVFAGVCIGQAAIALLVGRRLSELVRPNTTPSPLAALLLGLIVVSAAEIVPGMGWLVTALMVLVGLGAAILGFVPSAMAGVRQPITGPPMTR
ncbi:MAG TPA: hypothetical protein VGG22_06235 [Candidatus Baltobacteraceae bacterium]|jgi:hypothetical protein